MNERPIAIVTGAAKGIGKAITYRLIADGFFVVAVDVDEETSKSIIVEYDKSKLFFIKTDICNEKAVKQLFQQILAEYKSVEVLVNNAGIIRDNMIWKMSMED